MSDRSLPSPDGPTYTSAEVAEIFKEYGVGVSLQSWDRSEIFRPSYYSDANGLMSRAERDARIGTVGTSRGDPHRAFTYKDLVWLKILLYVRARFRERDVPNATRRASDVVLAAKRLGYESPPHAARFLFIDEHVYLVDGSHAPQCLTPGNQIPFAQMFACEFSAELEGRMRILERDRRIHTAGLPAGEDEAPLGPQSAHG